MALPFAIFSPSVIATGIEVWTWIIGERPDLEFSLITELSYAWNSSIKQNLGGFSESMKYINSASIVFVNLTNHFPDSYSDPFVHSIGYSPTDKSIIDHEIVTARKLLTPHILVLQMLLSRFQAARYHKSGLMLLILRLVLRTANAHQNMR